MKKELGKYLYQSNDELLQLFKQGHQGEVRFIEFMTLVREEKVPEDVISMAEGEGVKIKEGIIEEFKE